MEQILYYYQIVELYQSTYQTIFLVTLLLIISGIKKNKLTFDGLKSKYVAAFFTASLLSVISPFTFHSIIYMLIFIGSWIYLIAPLWDCLSVRGKYYLALATYPGTVMVTIGGTWPCNLFPGVLAVPFSFSSWQPAPFFSMSLSSVGNTKGADNALLLELFSLATWSILLGVLIISKFYRNNTIKFSSHD